MYRNGQTWSRNRERKISMAMGDTLIDKNHSNEVIRDYDIQEGFSLGRIQNDKFRYIAMCRNLDCT